MADYIIVPAAERDTWRARRFGPGGLFAVDPIPVADRPGDCAIPTDVLTDPNYAAARDELAAYPVAALDEATAFPPPEGGRP